METRLGPHHSSRERSLTFPYRSVKVRKKVFVSQFILVHFTFRWTCQPNFSLLFDVVYNSVLAEDLPRYLRRDIIT